MDINKKLGKKIVFQGDEKQIVPVLKSGMPALDSIIGGGFPQGKIAEVYGLQATGKTTLALQVAVHAQQENKKVVWVDLENAWDREYTEKLGMDSAKLTMVRPEFGEEAFEAIELLLPESDLIVLDSIPALAPRAELEADFGTPTMGGQARLISSALRKLIPVLEKSGAVLLLINQLRVNLMGGQYDPYVRPGGYSLRFYERTCIELKRKMALKQGNNVVGAMIQAKAIKSYSTAPFRSIEMTLINGVGFSVEADILSLALEKGIVERKGNTYRFHGETLGVGQAKVREYLKLYPQQMALIKKEL